MYSIMSAQTLTAWTWGHVFVILNHEPSSWGCSWLRSSFRSRFKLTPKILSKVLESILTVVKAQFWECDDTTADRYSLALAFFHYFGSTIKRCREHTGRGGKCVLQLKTSRSLEWSYPSRIPAVHCLGAMHCLTVQLCKFYITDSNEK
jgi:hypothetical protein